MSSSGSLGTSQINIPQLLAVALVSFLAIRWLLKPSPASAGQAGSRRGGIVDVSRVNQVSAMFPQLDRRAIAWDLSRNGQNVSATTERVLAGRTLDTPPPSFQPIIPGAATAGSASSNTSRRDGGKTGHNQDLITRYGLQDRVNGKGKEREPSEEMKRNAWSADKASRAEGFKRRREEMVLAARRKMQEADSKSS